MPKDKKTAAAGEAAAFKETKAKNDENEENEEEGEGEDVDPMEELAKDLAPEVYRRVVALRKQQEGYTAIDEEYKADRIALEKKYAARRSEAYVARKQIVSGEVDVPAEEGEQPASASEGETKGVPSFWLNALASNHLVGNFIAEEDDAALEFLYDITLEYAENFESFTLFFHFKENEFFTNTVLTKKYVVSPDLLDERNPSLVSVEGTEIDWKEGKNLTVTEVKKKQKAKSGKNKGQVRTITKQEPKPSFFNYFKTPKQDDDDEEDEEEKEEEQDVDGPRTKLSMNDDYEIGHTIRSFILPEAVLWYTGEAVEDFDFLEAEDDYDEEEEDDDAEEEEEEEEEQPKAKGKKSKGKGFAGASAGAGGDGEKPECKQT